MPEKKRYLISNRLAPQLDPETVQDLKDFVESHDEAELVKLTSVGRHVIEMTEEQKRTLEQKHPDLVIEEDRPMDMYPAPMLPKAVFNTEGKYVLELAVKDSTTGAPVKDVTIYAIAEGASYKAVTDEQGDAMLASDFPLLPQVIASPRDTYWSRIVDNVDLTTTQSLEIRLKPLLVTGAHEWGVRLMEFPRVNRLWRGKGVKVGVIDSGVAKDLPDIKPVGGYNTLDAADPDAWYVDEKGHGTHCTGIISGHADGTGINGGAPEAEVYSVKVFPGGYTSDIVEAVEWCIRNKMDVVNMSLGTTQYSAGLENVLKDAYQRGITVVAATGNNSSSVSYPAAYRTTIAVSAIGRLGTFPEDSDHSRAVTDITDWRGQLFGAQFSNFGPEVEVCAPGVAILSTVPSGYVSWDGTSFATPLVCALVALILEAYPAIRTGDARQPEYVRSILRGASVNLGMPPLLQGYGLPLATRALAAARPRQQLSARNNAAVNPPGAYPYVYAMPYGSRGYPQSY